MVIRLRLPAMLKSRVISAVGRLELKFDPRIGLMRVKRYKFDLWTEVIPYSCLFAVSRPSLSLPLRLAGLHGDSGKAREGPMTDDAEGVGGVFSLALRGGRTRGSTWRRGERLRLVGWSGAGAGCGSEGSPTCSAS